MFEKVIAIAAGITTTVLLLLLFSDKKPAPIVTNPPVFVQPYVPPPQQPVRPSQQISVQVPGYLDYSATVQQLQKWNQEAPELTEVGTYGKSSQGKDIYFIRVNNQRITQPKPIVLITACIHGNEPHASSTVMGYIGTLLSRYGKDGAISNLIDSRDIYFVPVVSPDSYPNSRHVDGVDPNRNFPTENDPEKISVAPVKALRDFFLKIKPNAVISGHTWGRVYLIPYGDKMANTPHHADFQRIVGQMATMSRYRMMRACDLYQGNGGLNIDPIRTCMDYDYLTPIFGSELDWYYRNGAMGIVLEAGTHQRIPSQAETQEEFERTFPAILHFIQEAPLVKLR